MKTAIVLLASLVCLPNTRFESIDAASNGVHYKLYIGLPANYEATDARYPVLYLLDADYSFPITQTVIKHLSERERLGPMIVVAIACDGCDQYTSPAYRMNRTRDYTPLFSPTGGYGPEFQKVSGGGPKFLEFIRTELFPGIDRDYRTTGVRGLVGHSYGGLFATWVLLTAPDTFSRYVIVSPSLWYANRFIFPLERTAKIATHARVYMAVGATEGNGEHDMVKDLERMAKALSERRSLDVSHEVFAGENHDSVFPTALSRGLRFVFAGD